MGAYYNNAVRNVVIFCARCAIIPGNSPFWESIGPKKP
jgi:hypothetical protein